MDEMSVYSEDIMSVGSDEHNDNADSSTKPRRLNLECRICLLDMLPDQEIVRSNLVSIRKLLSNSQLSDK